MAFCFLWNRVGKLLYSLTLELCWSRCCVYTFSEMSADENVDFSQSLRKKVASSPCIYLFCRSPPPYFHKKSLSHSILISKLSPVFLHRACPNSEPRRVAHRPGNRPPARGPPVAVGDSSALDKNGFAHGSFMCVCICFLAGLKKNFERVCSSAVGRKNVSEQVSSSECQH